jgi:uncharacterized protein YceK
MNPLKASLFAVALLASGCTTVRLLRDPSTLSATGQGACGPALAW